MSVDAEPTAAFFEQHKASLASPAAPAAETPKVVPPAPADNADKPADGAPSGEPAAPAAKAPDLSLFEADDRERIQALPLEAQEAAVKVAKRMEAAFTRKTQAVAKEAKFAEMGKRLFEDETERKDYFRWRQERLVVNGEAAKPPAPKPPKDWTGAASNEDLDKVARETVQEEVEDLRAEVRALKEQLVVPRERAVEANAAFANAAEARGIDPKGKDYNALIGALNETLLAEGIDPVAVVNEQNAASYVLLAQMALKEKQPAAPTPSRPPARAATINSSGNGRPVVAPKPWEVEKRPPTEAEFFIEHAKSQYGLTAGDLAALRQSGARVITSAPT